MWKWQVIFYGFHNSQAIWPNDRHAWQQLLLHSLAKLGVTHWVCAGCNKSAMCRARLGHIERNTPPWKRRNIKISFPKRKFKNIHFIFPSRNVHILFLYWCRYLLHPPSPNPSPFYFVNSWLPLRQIRLGWVSLVFPLLTHSSEGNKIKVGPCTTCGGSQGSGLLFPWG